jgi:AcrR family transcriptional regulator
VELPGGAWLHPSGIYLVTLGNGHDSFETMQGTRRPNAAGTASRLKIVKAASDLVAAHGHRGVSIKQVAEKAGLTDAGVLHHFETREELLNAVLDLRDDEDNTEFGSGTSLSGFLRLMKANMKRPGIVRLFATMSAEATDPEHPVHQELALRYERAVAELEADLRRRQNSGELRADLDPAFAARLTIAAADGLQVQWLYNNKTEVSKIMNSLASLFTAPPGTAAEAH